MRQKRNGSHLILMELMFVLFFFAICGAVLLQVFVKSHNISVKAKELTEIKNCVTQAAELFETGYTDIEHYQEYFPKLEEDQGIYQGYFDKDWKMTKKKNAVYKMTISFDDQGSDRNGKITIFKAKKQIYHLELLKHLPGGKSNERS